jgi:putative membrane protein
MSKAQTYFIVALLFALSVAVFAIQNTESISINFLFWPGWPQC